MNYNRLENSLIDVIKEEQAKLGYMKEKIRCLCCGGFPAVTRFARHLRWLDTSTECGLFSADYRGRVGG